jgi:hypothetical protein
MPRPAENKMVDGRKTEQDMEPESCWYAKRDATEGKRIQRGPKKVLSLIVSIFGTK